MPEVIPSCGVLHTRRDVDGAVITQEPLQPTGHHLFMIMG